MNPCILINCNDTKFWSKRELKIRNLILRWKLHETEAIQRASGLVRGIHLEGSLLLFLTTWGTLLDPSDQASACHLKTRGIAQSIKFSPKKRNKLGIYSRKCDQHSPPMRIQNSEQKPNLAKKRSNNWNEKQIALGILPNLYTNQTIEDPSQHFDLSALGRKQFSENYRQCESSWGGCVSS